uniref:Uncharacterized protein n=1 Tax=Rhodopseudomonas palustris (strain BisA53) TaxID=316055 RepID=Q07P79_RHOP5
MTLFSSAHNGSPRRRPTRRGHHWPLFASAVIAGLAIAAIVYLLKPTWHAEKISAPDRTPVSVGGTLFNVPTPAFRVKVQKHSGPQERVDLHFNYPSLQAPEKPKHVTIDTVEQIGQPIDRIFLSIAEHNDALAPDQRLRTIYPRYLDSRVIPAADGLTQRAFRDGTPYGNEDLFTASDPELAARCSRDAATPGMCLSERRIDGADLTFRFPRQWLTQWREVAVAMDRLTLQLHATRN